MIRWEHLDTAAVPGGDELRLMRRGREYSIMAGSIELMNSRLSGSEEALATLTQARLAGRPRPRVLIGGLGMGFTLRAALEAYGPDAELVVAELVPDIVAWARDPLAEVFGTCLDDPRTKVEIGDVADQIRSGGPWDAILLDVDNGPGGLTRAENDGLYGHAGLAAAKAALTSGGLLAVWSSVRDNGFTRRLSQAGFKAEEIGVRAHRGRGARHVIWIAAKP